MLYIYSLGVFIINLFHINSVFLSNILFKLPTIIADCGICYLMYKIFKNKPKEVLIYYFLSPVIFYAAIMHSQLDLVPVAFLFLAFYYIKKAKIYQASIVFTIACCTKANAILLFPIILIFLLKNYGKRKTLLSFLIVTAGYALSSMPYIFSEAYRHLVLMNPQQNLLFELSVHLKNIYVYMPLLVLTLIYMRFLAYKKINTDLLDSYCVLTISVFLIFIPPITPAWYIWLVPFLTLFIIRYSNDNSLYVKYSYYFFNLVYIIYFVFLHHGSYGDLSVFAHPVNLKLSVPFFRNVLFTLLEAFLTGIIYYIYKFGVKSNSIYKKEKAIIIGIGGDSGSGKTTLLNDINGILGDNTVFLEGDCTHKWERGNSKWSQYTHLDPKANYLHEFVNNLITLKNFKPILYKEYNHDTGKFNAPVSVKPKSFIVLSGLHTFYLPKMRRVIDIKIFLAPEENLRKNWKIVRDVKGRGYDKATVLNSIAKRTNDALKYITPQKDFADLIINYFMLDEKSENCNIENLGLKIEFDSSIYIDDLINYLLKNDMEVEWNYSENLKTQYIIIRTDVSKIEWINFAIEHIENIDEIISQNPEFSAGLRGFIQFILLRLISEKMKDDYDKRNID